MSESVELMTITRQQHDNLMQMAEVSRQLAATVQQLGQALAAINSRMARFEKMMDVKVTVTSMQAKTLNKAIRERAKVLCEKHDLLYSRDGKLVRAAISRAVLSQYAVHDIHDVPASYYDLALGLIKRCVQYVKGHVKGKKIAFHITTNGTLLDPETFAYLNEQGF
ncbi:MAG: hypothetical protein IKE25_11235, partial [Clostridia bacterium]|nr:hypothetical protein [Clostridia bacterium]